MFEPLREILPEDPQALLEDARVLGEKAGRLYGSRSAATYTAMGGAVYAPLRCVNEGVVGWGSVSDAITNDNDNKSPMSSSDAASSSSYLAKSSSAAGGVSWFADAWSWLGSSSLPRRARAGKRQQQRRRLRRGRPLSLSAQLRCICAAAPHVVPRLLKGVVTMAALAFPSLRSLCPSALPDAADLLEARQSAPFAASSAGGRSGGPERVTAVCFHPLYVWLAVAIDEGAADGTTRVVLYNAVEGRVACVLSHAFQKDVAWLQWKPFASNVLAVGCRGGVLLWGFVLASSAQAGPAASAAPAAAAAEAAQNVLGNACGVFGASAAAQLEASARALFYRIRPGFQMTAGAFSHCDGSMLACASMTDTRLHLLNVRQPPFSPQATAAVVVPSIDGGIHEVLFDDDDLFLICAVCEHPSLALVRSPGAAGSTSASASYAANAESTSHHVTLVPIPAPVHCMARASGLGPSLYFLSTKGLEGVLLARINPFIGAEVISMISTGLYRGVGGAVTRFACSRRRLWMLTETHHLVVCHYGRRGGEVTVLPVGVATTEAVDVVNYSGCTWGSMAAVLEEDGTIQLIPSYHA